MKPIRVIKAIVKEGDVSTESIIPPEYTQKPQQRREEPKMEAKPKSTYLRQLDTGRIYVFNEQLAQRADMEPYEMPGLSEEREANDDYDDSQEESLIPEEKLDQLMGEVSEETLVGHESEETASGGPADTERMELIKEAISKILPEEYTKAIGNLKPSMPKVKQVSDLAGFKVSAAEIIEAMG